jgi:hypothetical protein
MPVAIQMTLQFQETTYLTKNKPNDPAAGDITSEKTAASQRGEFGTS